jgi:hypothetical protein
LGLDPSDRIAEGDIILGQRLKMAVIIHLRLHLRSFVSRNAFIEFVAVKVALQDEVRAAWIGMTGLWLEELLAEGTAAQMVNGLHFLEDAAAFFAERIKGFIHGS